MTSIDPLSGNERAYLDAYRDASAMPDAARERVWSRLTIGTVGPDGGPDDGPGSGEAANDPGPAGLEPAIAEVARRAWWTRAGLVLGASVAVVVSGAVILALREPTEPSRPKVEASSVTVASEQRPRVEGPPPPEPVDEAPEAEAIAVPLAPVNPPAIDTEVQPSAPRARAKARPKAAPTPPAEEPRTSSLAEERRLIERAHAALANDDSDGALAILHEHAREFEAGIFVEEREALRVIATCTAGRLDEGRDAASRFLASYPNAVLAARVRNTCALDD